MKNLICIVIVLMAIISACKKDSTSNKIQNIELSSCTGSPRSLKSTGSCVTIKSLADKSLKISHSGAEFSCESTQLGIDYSLVGDTIVIEEIDKGPFSYCNCNRDVSFKIGALNYGTYKIKVIESASSYHRDTLIYTFNHANGSNFTSCK